MKNAGLTKFHCSKGVGVILTKKLNLDFCLHQGFCFNTGGQEN